MKWIAAAALLFALTQLFSGCSGTPSSTEPGFSAYCASHPHVGTCP